MGARRLLRDAADSGFRTVTVSSLPNPCCEFRVRWSRPAGSGNPPARVSPRCLPARSSRLAFACPANHALATAGARPRRENPAAARSAAGRDPRCSNGARRTYLGRSGPLRRSLATRHGRLEVIHSHLAKQHPLLESVIILLGWTRLDAGLGGVDGWVVWRRREARGRSRIGGERIEAEMASDRGVQRPAE